MRESYEMKLTNTANISLPLAVWLLHDSYDYQTGQADRPHISATSLMKPVRVTVLSQRLNPEFVQKDLIDFIPTALGHSIHDSIEKAWKHDRSNALKKLGYPEDVIKRVRVNPKDEDVLADAEIIPVYIEQRLFYEFDGYILSGKFDMVTEGIVNDFKSTSAFTWLNGTKDSDYALQGSIYRWLDSKQKMPKITEDFIRVNFIFTDWQKFQAKTNPAYPQQRVETRDIPLMSLVETEAWIINRIAAIKRALPMKETDIPHCSDEELWMSETQYKYYANPAATAGRSTKNFETLADANKHLQEAGKGVVITVSGEPKRCGYCDAFDICSQRRKWFNE
jgi:hypothetical protein